MKKILFVRHAKTSHDDIYHSDHDRELTDRGVSDCVLMSEIIKTKIPKPEYIYCSSSIRTIQTMKLLQKSLSKNNKNIYISDELYTFDKDKLYEWIRGLNDKYEYICIIGHNELLLDIINDLGHIYIGKFPTCAICLMDFANINKWSEVQKKTGNIELLEVPKNYKKSPLGTNTVWVT